MAATVGNIAIGFVAATGGFTGGANRIIKQLGQIHVVAQATTKIVGAFSDTLERMDTLVDTADNLNIATDALISLRLAAEQSGSSAAGIDAALGAMNKNVGLAAMGVGRAGAAINELGLDVQALKSLAPEQMFSTFADAISKVDDKSQQAAIASRIFGDEGGKMLTLLRGGSSGLAEFDKQAEEMGLHLGQGARDAATAHDAIAALTTSITGLGDAIVNAAAPALTDFAKDLQFLVNEINSFLNALAELNRLRGGKSGGGGAVATPDAAPVVAVNKELQKAQQELGKLMIAMQEQVITQDMTAAQKAARAAAKLNATPQDQAMIARMQEMLEKHNAQTAAIEKQREAYQKLARDAAAVTEKMRTPLETLQAEMAHLTEMFNAGLLDFVTFSRAAADLQKDFEKTLPKQEGPRSAAFMAEGSAAAFSNANINKTNGLENIARQQLRKQGEAVTAMAQVEAAINNGFKTIHTFAF